jgi:uncharacterized protein YyaL (SSP411 family)
VFMRRFEPFATLAYAVEASEDTTWPTLGDRPLPAGAKAAAYLCQGRACLPPITDPASLATTLTESSAG